jgi:hypothetical protein
VRPGLEPQDAVLNRAICDAARAFGIDERVRDGLGDLSHGRDPAVRAEASECAKGVFVGLCSAPGLLGALLARNSGIGPRSSVRLAMTISSRSSSWSWSISWKGRRFARAIVCSPGLSRL